MSEQHRWIGVEVRHLAALRAVARTRSFAGAGTALGYSQSAISLQIAALERIAGTALLERPGGRRPVVPTAAGELVLRHASRLVDQIRAAEADLTALASGRAGVISLGTFPSASRHLLPSALRALRASHPGLELRLDESPHAAQAARLATGETDLSLVLLPFEGPFEICELLADRYVLIAAADGSQAARGLPSLPELAGAPMISWRQPPFAIETLLRSHGHEPTVVLRTDDSATVQRLVAGGLGIAVLSRLALDLPDPALTVLDAGAHLAPRRLGIAWHRDRRLSPAAEAVVAALRAAARPLAAA